MTTAYVTITDVNYLVRAWALYRSFAPDPSRIFYFYCIDRKAVEILSALDPTRAVIVPYEDFATPELDAVRAQRATNEFCWTCKPAILLHALAQDPGLSWVVYMDSDMMVFSDPQKALVEAGNVGAVITPHRWSGPRFARFEKTAGAFNAGCIAFSNTPKGRDILGWWSARCIESCPAVPEDEIYADQKYLDRMPGLFGDAAHISTHPGFNAAPWNIDGCRLAKSGGTPLVDGQPLILFHFQGLRIHGRRFFDLYAGPHHIRSDIRNIIYRPYIRALSSAFVEISAVFPGFSRGAQPMRLRQWLTQGKRFALGTSNLAIADASLKI